MGTYDERYIYKYTIATMTRSGPQSTTSYKMEVDAKDKV